jgi:diamine N-acetyltransferase
MSVHLREINADTVRAVTKLSVTVSQQDFVASNAVSLAQALFSDEAWYRAIHDGDDLVGFLMLADSTLKREPPLVPSIFLWRFMIDQHSQRRGLGRAALDCIVEHVRTRPGISDLYTSYVPKPGGPGPFYLKYGFVPTGEVDDGEVVLRLALPNRTQ